MSTSIMEAIDDIRVRSRNEAEKGRLFENLMKSALLKDVVYEDRFERIWRWSEWAKDRDGFNTKDTGVDLVALERDGGYCAIQCKLYNEDNRLTKRDIDSFFSTSEREPFTSRLLIYTGRDIGPNAKDNFENRKIRCNILHPIQLSVELDKWPVHKDSEVDDIVVKKNAYQLREHQKKAVKDIETGFQSHERGKLIMACGTGKTFVSLRAAEKIAGVGGRVLYLVPSISLLQQTMREWAEQKEVKHKYIGICSDTRAGRDDEDSTLTELELPVTTNLGTIAEALCKQYKNEMLVVFCTYQSLELIEKAQSSSAPMFDFTICDEAHRTTGIELSEKGGSPFTLIHDGERIKSKRRLYMTATPKLYRQNVKDKAADHSAEIYSMDDIKLYGPELHHLNFSNAVDQGLLTDYKVIVFGVSEEHVDAALQKYLADAEGDINLTDAAKIVGCWSVMMDPEDRKSADLEVVPIKRAIAFTNTIRASEHLVRHWSKLVEYVKSLDNGENENVMECSLQHVDGKHHALDRRGRLEWLKGNDGPRSCRVLSNARCLSEGVDVPALDAVMFMSPKSSKTDIVQAVGRVMRKFSRKEYGYIILPVVVPSGVSPENVLDDNTKFAAVWNVLSALRSHDERFDIDINRMDLSRKPSSKLIFRPTKHLDEDDTRRPTGVLKYPPLFDLPGWDIDLRVFHAKVVEKCGDRRYWESWAKDVADIFKRLVGRIDRLLQKPENKFLREWYDSFYQELKGSINENITKSDAIEMMAQHIITEPVFSALFENYKFSQNNPVARALDKLREDFSEFGLEAELSDVEGFYESVRSRARGLDNSEARQRVLMELYEKFFTTAMKKDAERLGIVYTPVEVVDFILNSANWVLENEFGKTFSSDNVHVLDPFAGTGIFLVRLLQSDLIEFDDLERKYLRECHTNEIVLLAYYIATVHIEEAYHGRLQEESDVESYEAFPGAVLCDTFTSFEQSEDIGGVRDLLAGNSRRAKEQRKIPIQVIVGNPPWSAGQRSVADENPNADYPDLRLRVLQTYAKYSTASLKSSLYDYYKLALRWASDRIGENGVIAFVTNGSWIDGRADSGIRACLEREFSKIYVLNLRGNARTSGEARKKEGDNVFGQGSRAMVAITLLVKRSDNCTKDCEIVYKDIGDYHTKAAKLGIIKEWGSIGGVENWQRVTPNEQYDWINQRTKDFSRYSIIGKKTKKRDQDTSSVFSLFSQGLKTGRDAWIYSYSKEKMRVNAEKLMDACNAVMCMSKNVKADQVRMNAVEHYPQIGWDDDIVRKIVKGDMMTYNVEKERISMYRPFVKKHCYLDYSLVQRKFLNDKIYPTAKKCSESIYTSGVGAQKEYSVLITNCIPDVSMMPSGQGFPRYRFENIEEDQPPDILSGLNDGSVNNLSNDVLLKMRSELSNDRIDMDDLFCYVYGLLHSLEYRERYKNDLMKSLPRIPFYKCYMELIEAGKQLKKLHLEYETCEEYPLIANCNTSERNMSAACVIGKKPMKLFGKKLNSLKINEKMSLSGIPADAHEYVVNGKSPLGWFIDQYQYKLDDLSGIQSNPNDWFEDPKDLISSIKRAVHVSVETVSIMKALPKIE